MQCSPSRPQHDFVNWLSAHCEAEASELQATQEKVAALMQAAEAKGNRRASGGGSKGPASSPAKPGAPGGGWRVRPAPCSIRHLSHHGQEKGMGCLLLVGEHN